MVTARKPASPRKPAKKPFDAFAYLMKRGDTLPDDVIARIPRDGAQNFDHYLDGTPKQY